MTNSIIIYDGNCIMCNSFIQKIITQDKGFFKLIDRNSKKFLVYQKEVPISATKYDTIYLLENNKVYWKAKAISKILAKGNSTSKLKSYLLSIVPLFLSNLGYDIIAKHRHSNKNTDNSCLLLTPQIIERLI